MGTVKVTNIEPIADNGTITIGRSGDTVDLGATAGGTLTNTPSFRATQSSNQTMSTGAFTKVTYDTVDYDTDNGFNTSTNKYTVPVAGKYVLNYATGFIEVVDAKVCTAAIYLNDVRENTSWSTSTSSGASSTNVIGESTCILNLSENDVLEVRMFHNNGNDRTNDAEYAVFSGYRLIGV